MNVLVVYCHPDPESFTAAVKRRAVAALEAARHDVRVSDLYGDGFDPAGDIDSHRDSLQWCQALVFVYPTWWSGQPAMLSGWLDAVLGPRFDNIRRLVTITTHGSPRYVNVLEGETGRRVISRAVRMRCHHFARTTWLTLYGIDRSTLTDRQAFLDRVDARMRRL